MKRSFFFKKIYSNFHRILKKRKIVEKTVDRVKFRKKFRIPRKNPNPTI